MWYLVVLIWSMANFVHGNPQVPCYFIFGASIFDDGNNNALVTGAKANYPPYGIDFPQGPTGRFTNGRNMGDLIAEHLGFDDYIPPFTKANGRQILKGVNYASGSSGIRDETGAHVVITKLISPYMKILLYTCVTCQISQPNGYLQFIFIRTLFSMIGHNIIMGGRLGMNHQLSHHQVTISRIQKLLGDHNNSASNLLKQCMYTVEVGNNDYINNYFNKVYPTGRLYTAEQYARTLIQEYTQELKTLYNYGARKMALFGVPPYGCAPGIIAKHGKNRSSCVDDINNAIQIFNDKLIKVVDELNNNLRDAKIIYVNYFQISLSVRKGFKYTNSSCCKVTDVGNLHLPMCIPFATLCPNRADYLYFDELHTTEAANVKIAERLYSAQFPVDTYPIDIRRLARL